MVSIFDAKSTSPKRYELVPEEIQKKNKEAQKLFSWTDSGDDPKEIYRINENKELQKVGEPIQSRRSREFL